MRAHLSEGHLVTITVSRFVGVRIWNDWRFRSWHGYSGFTRKSLLFAAFAAFLAPTGLYGSLQFTASERIIEVRTDGGPRGLGPFGHADFWKQDGRQTRAWANAKRDCMLLLLNSLIDEPYAAVHLLVRKVLRRQQWRDDLQSRKRNE
jgi:hypothetical protein